MSQSLDVLANGARSLGLALNEGQLADFGRYLELLLEWNERLNLTRIVEPAAIQTAHFLDSLSCTAATGDLSGQRLLDVGSGAGFPGIPLKLLFRDLRLTLVESKAKKCRFLVEVVSALALDEVAVLAERAEIVGREPEHREQYDWAVARAVAPLPVLAEYLLPLCRIGGLMLAMKGSGAPAEAEEAAVALRVLGGGEAGLTAVRPPGIVRERYLVVVTKERPTPDKYPRRPGMAGKRPLEG